MSRPLQVGDLVYLRSPQLRARGGPLTARIKELGMATGGIVLETPLAGSLVWFYFDVWRLQHPDHKRRLGKEQRRWLDWACQGRLINPVGRHQSERRVLEGLASKGLLQLRQDGMYEATKRGREVREGRL